MIKMMTLKKTKTLVTGLTLILVLTGIAAVMAANYTPSTPNDVGAEAAGSVATHAEQTSGVHGLRPATMSHFSSAMIPPGGGSGQKLIKNSAASYDTTWGTDIDLALSDSTPVMSGVAAPGTGTTASRNDHRHPIDTSRAAQASFANTSSASATHRGLTTSAHGGIVSISRMTNYSTNRQAQFSAYLPLVGGTINGSIAATGNITSTGGQLSANGNVLAGANSVQIGTNGGSPAILGLGYFKHWNGSVWVVDARIDTSGNFGINTTSPTSKLHVVGLPVYANNAAAVAGGLTVGAFYHTGADPDPVCVVH